MMMTMVKMMLLLMSSAPLLGHPTGHKVQDPDHAENRLRPIIDVFKNNISLPTEDFDDVRHLAQNSNRCGIQFFCKVHKLLQNQTHKELSEIARHLGAYNKAKQFDCKSVHDKLGKNGNFIKAHLLRESLIECIRYRIWNGNSTEPIRTSKPKE